VLNVVAVRATEAEIFIYDSEIRLIAHHQKAPQGQVEPVIDSSHKPSKKKRHDLDLLVKRMEELGDAGSLFAAGVLEIQRYRGTHLAQVLGLVERYSADDLVKSLERAVRYRAFDGNVVSRILETTATPRVLPDANQQAARERLGSMLPATPPRSLALYGPALKGDSLQEQS